MLRQWIMISVPFVGLIAGGLTYGYTVLAESNAEMGAAATYVCPVTGEDLPCPNCCPLNR